MMDDTNLKQRRCGFVTLMGPPNAGKSTLLNALVGSKVAIVTHKVQTTRFRIRGVLLHNDCQMVFTDTPGLFKAKSAMEKSMVKTAWGAAKDADAIVLILDAQLNIADETRHILSRLSSIKPPVFLALNKIDRLDKASLLTKVKELNNLLDFEDTFLISALKHDGLDHFQQVIAERMPVSPWHFPEDQLTDMNLRLSAAEITREKLMLRVHSEVPYQATVETSSWQQKREGFYHICQTIYVAREGQKKIIVGAGGQTIKAIGTLARKEISNMIDAKVHLELFVKVKPNWVDRPSIYGDLGLEI